MGYFFCLGLRLVVSLVWLYLYSIYFSFLFGFIVIRLRFLSLYEDFRLRFRYNFVRSGTLVTPLRIEVLFLLDIYYLAGTHVELTMLYRAYGAALEVVGTSNGLVRIGHLIYTC